MNISKLKLTVSALLVIFLITSCSSLRNKDNDYDEIVFGWGGGVTGAVEEYHVLKDGTIKKGQDIVRKLPKRQMKKVTKAFGKIDFKKVILEEPGNMYYFLSSMDHLSERRLTWTDESHVPTEVKKAYDILVELVKK